MYGKRFVLTVETDSSKPAFVIAAGTRSRDGEMRSQLTLPVTNRAVQI